MRLSDETRYPHPVLGPLTNDYTVGEFSVSFSVSENVGTSALTLIHEITLTEPSLLELVKSGKATVGCIVVCRDTYYNQLHKLSFENGSTDFQAGSLLNRVTLRPVIWLNDEKAELTSEFIHPEFGSSITVTQGDIIAIDMEYVITVGKAKLATMESIFELTKVPNMEEGKVEIDLECERIAILLGPKTFEAINLLRGQSMHQSVMLSAVYLPAVMEVLDQLRSNAGTYADRRWYTPFIAKCDLKGITLNENTPLLQGGQALLNNPVAKLEQLMEGDSKNGD
ncbi:hypothetical protein C8E02_3359 [Vogesella indigofera]|uniref:Uncharacterized protein n=1 Tax=Vogesella indigofera TaxID=45465 RepID=A0A495AX35_VOGIN|nr:hypothetical protein [Vogesella indigofera]RKQ52890.1 hypothetical protein C8E02_3359 [Vogesella indigofera]